jgi:hypothetical protein
MELPLSSCKPAKQERSVVLAEWRELEALNSNSEQFKKLIWIGLTAHCLGVDAIRPQLSNEVFVKLSALSKYRALRMLT